MIRSDVGYDTGRGTAHAVFWCIVAVISGAKAARAADPPTTTARTSSLSWIRLPGAESCIATQALAQAVEQRLGRRVFVSAADADLSVEGRAERTKTPAGFRAVFEVRDREGTLVGTREIKNAGTDCAPMGESIAFVLSVLIEPTAPAGDPTNGKQPDGPRDDASPAQLERVTVYVPVSSPVPVEPAVRVNAHVGGVVEVGSLPKVGPGLSVGMLVEPKSFWGIYLGGTYLFERDAEPIVDSEGRRATATASAAMGTLGLCPLVGRFGQDRVLVAGCAGASLGSMRSRGAGFTVSSGDESFLAQASIFAHAAARIVGPLTAAAGLAVATPLIKGRLLYRTETDVVTVFSPTLVSASATAGLGVRFP